MPKRNQLGHHVVTQLLAERIQFSVDEFGEKLFRSAIDSFKVVNSQRPLSLESRRIFNESRHSLVAKLNSDLLLQFGKERQLVIPKKGRSDVAMTVVFFGCQTIAKFEHEQRFQDPLPVQIARDAVAQVEIEVRNDRVDAVLVQLRGFNSAQNSLQKALGRSAANFQPDNLEQRVMSLLLF